MNAAAAFDIGGSKIEFARVHADGAVTDRATLPTPHTGWADFADAITTLVDQAGGAERIGISIAGTVDPANGIAQAANLPSINGHRIEAELAERLGIPVKVGNDADCFALAEAHVGAGRDLPIVFAIILGTGVGGGIVVGGRLVRGAHGVTGEWGHGPLVGDTIKAHGITLIGCGCGQTGCLDTYGSARGLERIHQSLAGEARTSQVITAAWHRGEPVATRTVEIFIDLLAGPLSVMVNTLGPSVIPVGGGLSSDTVLLDRLDKAVRNRVLGRYTEPLVVPGLTRGASGLIGAAMLTRETAP